MIDRLKTLLGFKARKRELAKHEDEDDARIENAQRDLASLQARGDKALNTLRTRHQRNHWGEAIEQMITGVKN